MVRLRALAREHQRKDCALVQRSVATLDARCTNLRQILLATFYLFGFLFSLSLQSLIHYLDGGLVSLLSTFTLHCAFAANVFLVLLFLHFVQWLVSSRLHSCVERLAS
jgi:hypothetical protein